MAHEQLQEHVTFKCSYCGHMITAVCSSYHFTEVCPACRGSVMIPRPKPSTPSAAPLLVDAVPSKDSGDRPAGHYANPGASVDTVIPSAPASQPTPDPATDPSARVSWPSITIPEIVGAHVPAPEAICGPASDELPHAQATTPLVRHVHALSETQSETSPTLNTNPPDSPLPPNLPPNPEIQPPPPDSLHPHEKPTESPLLSIPANVDIGHFSNESAPTTPPLPPLPSVSDRNAMRHNDVERPESTPPARGTRVIEQFTPLNIEKLNSAQVEATTHSSVDTPAIIVPPVQEIDAAAMSNDSSRPGNSKIDTATRRLGTKALDSTHATGVAPSSLPPPPPETLPAKVASENIQPQRKPRVRWGLVAATLAIFIAAGVWMYMSFLNGLALENRKNVIDATLAKANHYLLANEAQTTSYKRIQGASSFAKMAQADLAGKDSAALDPKFVEERNAQVKSLLDAAAKSSDIENVFAKKENDLPGVKKYLDEHLSLWKKERNSAFVVLSEMIREKQSELATFESDQKIAKLRDQLKDANTSYKEQKLDESGKIAEAIVAAMKSDPVVQDIDLQKRAEILIERAARWNDTAKSVNAATGDNASFAKKRLQNEIGKLDPANEDLKPLLNQYQTLLGKLDLAEAASFAKTAQNELLSAEALYKQSKVELAAESAAQFLSKIPSNLTEQSRDLIQRARALVEHGKQFDVAAQIRASGKGDKIPDAKKRLQAQIDKIAASKADVKPLLDRLEIFKSELIEDERAIKKTAQREKKRGEGTDYALNTPDAAALLMKLKRFAELDERCVPGELDFDGFNFDFDHKPYKLCFHREADKKTVLFLETDDNKIIIDPRHFEAAEKTFRPRWHRAFYHAMALADAMTKAGVKSDDYWDSKEEAPFVSARRIDKQGNEYIFLGDRLFTGKAQEKTDQQKKIESEFRAQAEALALAVEQDDATPEDIRKTISFAVRASAVEVDWNDHLEGEYVRKVIQEGYIETNMPGSAERLKKELAAWRDGYKVVSEPFMNFIGSCPEGEATELRTYEDRAVWRLYDKKSDMTTFAITNPDDEKDCLFILFDFPGKLTEMPADKPAAKVRMTHQAVGVLSWYDPATNKMEFDKQKWDFAAGLELPPLRDNDRLLYGYGTAAWSHPPHVLLIDKSGRTKALVTPYGRVDVTDFKKITDVAARQKAMDAFLDQLTIVLPNKTEGCYPHLYFRYFFQYILDSPVTTHPDLLGSRGHTGDIHQTTYQSLERLMGGRYVGDCDDIAELYMTLERKMGNLSYVMSLPGHAACGWAEKKPNDSTYRFYILQTGPVRRFEDTSLDKVVEKAYRAFDPEGTTRFDPKSLAFNFRFNNEPTRTTYYLSSRMFVDAKYGEAMERVQSYWHFHFYALGIKTMDEMIKSGDNVSENWNEIAGLYGQVREVEDSIRCSHESIKNLKKEERLSRMSEEYRIATMWRSEHDSEKSYETIRATIAELKQIQRTPETFEYLGMRMQVAGLLLAVDRPWETWDLLRPDIELLGKPGNYFLKLDHVGVLTSAYLKMQDLIRARKVLTKAESRQMSDLLKVLRDFYSNGKAIFEDSDGFDDYMRKYASIGIFYAGKVGRKRYVEELMKDGPYPEIGKKRDHENRKNPDEEEDWKWIRVSLLSYSIAIGDAIDLDDPPEKWRIDEAIKLCDRMQKAGIEAAKHGSLGPFDFLLNSNRVLRDFLVKDWTDLEKVIQATAIRNWAKDTSDIAETFARGARFCTPEEFATQFKMFTKYIKSKPIYFTVVYEAYRADGIKHALAASKISLECNPGDEDMKREADYLEKLAEKRLKNMAEKEKADKAKAEKEKAEKEKAPKGTAEKK